MIQWIFFDIGNVILNDDPAMAYLYKEIYRAARESDRQVTLSEMLVERERSILIERNGKHYVTVGKKYLDRHTWRKVDQQNRSTLAQNWGEFSPLMPRIVPVIKELAARFNLGIIANQPMEVEEVLKNLDLLKYFKVHGISQQVGLSKPNPALFQWALDQAVCAPQSAIMIGDRVDNDVQPAKSIGMKTLWLSLPLALKGYQPKTEFEKRYFQSLARASASRLEPKGESETPDTKVEDFESIIPAINRLSNS